MMRSLFSGVSGLKVHQTKMDVIGNNIANVNTLGFRASTVSFTDVFYQTSKSASGPNANTGKAGTNAMQIGLGSDLSSISVNLSGTGSTQRTDRGMDVMISGDAFFIVNSNGINYFTKAGNFNTDGAGNLMCQTNGGSVMGWQVDGEGNIRKDTVSALKIMAPENQYVNPSATTAITLSGNIDQNDKQVQSTASGYTIAVNFYNNLGESFLAKLVVKQSATDPAIYSVSISDILGGDSKSILKKEVVTDAGVTYKSTSQPIQFAGQSLTYEVDENSGVITFTEAPGTLKFNGSTGAFVSVSSDNNETLNLNLNPGVAGNAFPLEGVEIDFSKLTMYATTGAISNVKPSRGNAGGYNAGNPAGKLDGFTIQEDGRIFGNYSNGDQKLLGQIAVASFPNPSGLEAVGNSLFSATQNSGDFDGVGIDITEVGKLMTGALEMSNVDLSTEFTSMITTQRGFQANSRIITTSDTLLEELINLKR